MNLLDKCYVLPQLIDSKEEEIRRLRELSKAIPGADPSREFISGGPKVQCKYADLIDKIVDLESEIGEEIDELLNCEIEARKLIASVEDPTCRTFLAYYYLDRLDMETIADKMCYSVRQLYRIKSKSRRLMSQENAI